MRIGRENFILSIFCLLGAFSGSAHADRWAFEDPWGCVKLLTSEERLSLSPEQRRARRVAYYNGGHHPVYGFAIRAEVVPEFQTIRFFHSVGRIPPGVQVRVLFLHGNGAIYSQAEGMREALMHASVHSREPLSKFDVRLKASTQPLIIGAEAIDLPEHGDGISADQVPDLASSAAYLSAYLRMMQAETPGIPIIVVSRSSSAVLSAAVAGQGTRLIQGLYMVSPTAVGNPEWIRKGTETTKKREKDGLIKLNHSGLAWIDRLLLEAQWGPHGFGGVPLRIVTGAKDWEVTPDERTYFQKLAEGNPSLISYEDVLNGEHNLLSISDKNPEIADKIWLDFFRFSREIVTSSGVKPQ